MGPLTIHIGTRVVACGLTTKDSVDALSRKDANYLLFMVGAIAGGMLAAMQCLLTDFPRLSAGLAARRNALVLVLSGIVPSALQRMSIWLAKYILN